MKTISSFFIIFILGISSFAQNAPKGFNYQAIARDNQGALLINQNLTVRFGIISGSSTGTLEWEETHSTITNAFGLFSVIIGQGTSTGNGSQTSFDQVDWSSNSFWLKVEIDAGNGLVDMGSFPFQSVPYSLTSQKVIELPEIYYPQLKDVDTTGLKAGQIMKWNGNKWLPADDANTIGGNTLDQAYDEGTYKGAGRIINADSGAVEIVSQTNNSLDVINSGPFASGIKVKTFGNAYGLDVDANSTGTGINVKATNWGGISVESDKWGIYSQTNSQDTLDAALELYGYPAAAIRIWGGVITVADSGSQFVGSINVVPGAWQALKSGTYSCTGCSHDHEVAYFQDVVLNNSYLNKTSHIFLTVESSALAYTAQVLSKAKDTATIRLIHISQIPPLIPTPLKINYMIINKF